MDRIRRSLTLVIALLVTTGLVACTPWGDGDTAELTVVVDGLPSDVPGQVTLAGQGDSWELPKSETLKVKPGRYDLEIAPVRLPDTATSYPTDERTSVTVEAGEKLTVTAGYRTTVPDTTKIVSDPARPPILSVDGRTVTLTAGEYAASLRVGDAIVVAEGPKTPDGLCRRVTALRRAGDSVVATTAPLRLQDALPAASIRFDAPPPPGRTTGPSRSGDRPILTTPARADAKPGPLVDVKLPLGDQAEAKASLTVPEFALNLDGEIAWNIPTKQAWVSLVPGVDYAADTRFELAGKTEGKGSREVGLGAAGAQAEKVCKRLVGRMPRVGPVSLGCGVRGVVRGEVATKGGLELNVGFDGSHTLPVVWGSGGPPEAQPVGGWPPKIDVTASSLAAGTAKVAAGLEFFFGGGDPVRLVQLGIGFNLRYGYDLVVDAAKRTADLAAYLEVGMTLELDMFAGHLGLAEVDLISPKRFDIGDKWHKDLAGGELNSREAGYRYSDLVAAMPAGAELPDGWRRKTDSAFKNLYCLEDGCPFSRGGQLAWATFQTGDKVSAWYWIKARAFDTPAAARNYVAGLSRRADQWQGMYSTTPKRLQNGISWSRKGVGSVQAPAFYRGARRTGVLVRRNWETVTTSEPGAPTASGQRPVVDEYLILQQHNAVIQVGGLETGLLRPGPMFSVSPVGVEPHMVAYLTKLGDPPG